MAAVVVIFTVPLAASAPHEPTRGELLSLVGVVGDVIVTGPVGAVVSTVNGTGALAGEVFPAPSVCILVTVWSPSDILLSGAIENVPPAVQMAVGVIVLPSIESSTVAPASQVPFISGVLSTVTTGLVVFASISVITGASGAVVSVNVNETGASERDVPPTVTSELYEPATVLVAVTEHLPVASVVHVVLFKSTLAGWTKVTTIPESRFPLLSLIVASSTSVAVPFAV